MKLDPDFVVVLMEIFGEDRTQAAIEAEDPEPLEALYAVWNRALDYERQHTFRFLRKFQTKFAVEIDPNLQFLSWVIANGSYRGSLDVHKRPWWLEDEGDWKAYVADRLHVRQLNAHAWQVVVQGTEELAGTIVLDEGCYEVRYSHAVESGAPVEHTFRRFSDYKSAMADIVAHQIMLENVAPTPHSENGGDGP